MVERLVDKVGRGEPLTELELELLARASRASPGPRLTIALAQGLVGSGRPAEALPVLDLLVSHHPRHPEVLLALGRALAMLERWAEAERPLKSLLLQQPHDVDALAALGVLSLRRGEVTKARAHAETALGHDPFHPEAQALLAELDALGVAPPDLPPKPSKREFLTLLRGELEKRDVPHLVHRGALLLKLGTGGVARLDVHELFADVLAANRPLGEGAAAVAKELAERTLGLPESKQALLDAALPVLREPAFLEASGGLAYREGPAGLLIAYAVSRPDLMLFVPEGLLERVGVSVDALDEAAFHNLNARPAPVRPLVFKEGTLSFEPAPTGLWGVATGDGHDGARLLTKAQQHAVGLALGRPGFVVWLGLRELALVCRADDAEWCGKLDGTAASEQGIEGTFSVEGGQLLRRERAPLVYE